MKYLLAIALMGSFLKTCTPGEGDGAAASSDSAALRSNVFFNKSNLPFEAIPWDKIKDADFRPAFEEGMRQHIIEVDSIANDSAATTFTNTVVALEKAGQMLDRVNHAFNVLTGANTNDTLQKIQEEMAPKLAAHHDAIYLNGKLFKKIDTLYNQRNRFPVADSEASRLVEYYHQQFLIAGAQLSDSNKTVLKKLNADEALLSTQFSNKLIAAAKAGALVLDSRDSLSGLTDAEVDAAAKAAQEAKFDGMFLIPLQNTTQQPALTSLGNRSTRQKLFEASWNRAERADSNDTRAIILQLAKIRAQKAHLLGFPNYAAWKLQDQMAKTPQSVQSFLSKIVTAAVVRARSEAQEIQKLISAEKDTFAVQPWDWNFYAEKVRKQKYDLDESQIKPYFLLDSVLQNGVFFAANKLYGISFKERKDLPVYEPDVRVFEVFDKDSSSMALFYTDYFKRDNKNGGAWMDNMVGQSKLLGTKPVIYNVCNFAKPLAGQPALLSWDDVTTLFHEFGHALHGLFANQTYPSLSGTNVSRDFVEFPSQFNEHWALDSLVFRNYARHYKTGEPMPQALVDKINKSTSFNQGYALTEILAAAQLDMQWHTLSVADADKIKSVDSFETAALKKTGLYLNYVPPRYRSSYFLHIWANGYSAGYYAYSWAEMLDNDAFTWFKENGGLTLANGQKFRDMILSKGNTEDLAALYKKFRGSDPGIQGLLQNRGLLK